MTIHVRKTREELLTTDFDDLDEWEQAWKAYFTRHPEVLASYGHQNGYLPHDPADED